MLRRAVLAGLAAGGAAPAAAQTKAQPRFALVIANSDYDHDGKTDASPEGLARSGARGYAGDLVNPWFDAVRVSQALKSKGFAVDLLQNAPPAMISGAVMRLKARADAAGPGAATILYYAGHGIQLGGRNYLVGTGAQLIVDGAPFETVNDQTKLALRIGYPVQELLMRTQRAAAPGYALTLIDACRDNPWEGALRAQAEADGRAYVGERGFGAMSLSTPRTVLCFSTSPGQLAVDGYAAASTPFAQAVARAIAEPGMTVDGLVEGLTGVVGAASGGRQQPWRIGRLGDGTRIAG